jgi:hypothetical protein
MSIYKYYMSVILLCGLFISCSNNSDHNIFLFENMDSISDNITSCHLSRISGRWELTSVELFNATDKTLNLLVDNHYITNINIDANSYLSPRGIDILQQLSSLTSLELPYNYSSDDYIRSLSNLRQIKYLKIFNPNNNKMAGTHKVFDAIGTMDHVETFDLQNIVDNNILNILSNNSHIKKLDCSGNDVTNEGILYISKLPELRCLYLSKADDDTIDIISKCPNIEELKIGTLKITNNYQILNRLLNIRSLAIYNISSSHKESILLPSSISQLLIAETDINRYIINDQCKVDKLYLMPGKREADSIDVSPSMINTVSNLKELSTYLPTKINCLSQLGNDINTIEVNNTPCNYDTSCLDDAIKSISRYTGLRKLVIYDYENISDKGMQYIKALSNLEELEITGHPNISLTGVKYISDLKNLRSLKIHISSENIYNKMDDIINQIIIYLPNLEKLELSGEISVKGFDNLKKLHNLKTLDITQSKGNTNEGIIKAMQNMPNLSEIIITYE